MKEINNLYDFVKYAETVIEDSNDFFLLTYITAANLSEEELLDDVKDALSIYYGWMSQAIGLEFYLMADTITRALREEIKHYDSLSKLVVKKSLINEINAIDDSLKDKYL
jgi:hypothetical protein